MGGSIEQSIMASPSSSPTRDGAVVLSASGTKKSAASLLPAFEPLSSSPALPRPLKRTRDAFEETRTYPTPVPTSSTHILSSSPPRASGVRPSNQRSLSTLSERAPLSTVPIVVLNGNGKPTRLGRSSASCDYQLSANRLISRIHVEATYRQAVSRLDRDRVEILCSGWNGIKVHCQSNVYDLKKGEMFSSDGRDDEIMLDVHDTRVVLQWPEKPRLGPVSSDEEEDEFSSPVKKTRAMRRHSTPPSPSPLQTRRRAQSPVSPSPAVHALLPSSPPGVSTYESKAIVEIYEDPVLPQDEEIHLENIDPSQQATQFLSQTIELASPTETDSNITPNPNDFSDNDEENDPIIHSFGPFGANLLPRMAAFNAADSPRLTSSVKSSRSAHGEPLQPTQSPALPKEETLDMDVDIKSHIVNQLAYSRLSSTPLSTILNHLPRDAASFTKHEVRQIMRDVRCIGEVRREGKDAAGKALESEYYYIPDEDDDEHRKASVVNDLRKPGLRACRKQHKQYYWRKPK